MLEIPKADQNFPHSPTSTHNVPQRGVNCQAILLKKQYLILIKGIQTIILKTKGADNSL
jgi:hypothetical protein